MDWLHQDLPKLELIKLGELSTEKEANNFYYADLILEDLPLLQMVYLGHHSFFFPHIIVFRSRSLLVHNYKICLH